MFRQTMQILGRNKWRMVMAIAIGTIGLHLGQAEAAPQLIWNQSPAAVERHLGRYWTRLTTKDAQGNQLVTYTYNPARVQRVFPESPRSKFSVVFVNNRAQAVEIANGSALLENFEGRMDDFFAAVFGERPNRRDPLYRKVVSDTDGTGGTLQYTQFCVMQGVAIGHEWVSIRDISLLGRITQDDRCRNP